MFKELYNALPDYGQVLLTLVIVGMGGLAAWYGFIENLRKHNAPVAPAPDPANIPMWLMMGPAHEAIQSLHEISRHIEMQNTILRDIDKTLEQMDRGQQYTHYVLEAILRDTSLNELPSRDPRYRR